VERTFAGLFQFRRPRVRYERRADIHEAHPSDSNAFANDPFDAAIWRNGVVTDLGVLLGDCFSEALVLNSKGQVAGGSFPCDFSLTRLPVTVATSGK
jgi:hypothetical protein